MVLGRSFVKIRVLVQRLLKNIHYMAMMYVSFLSTMHVAKEYTKFMVSIEYNLLLGVGILLLTLQKELALCWV